MSNIWSGATPTGATDANDYELGSVVCALKAVTLNGIRVWSPSNAVNRTNRRGHVWDMSGNLLATITMTDALPPGWSTHLLGTPLPLNPGEMVVISYETSGNYGIVNNAFVTSPHTAADGGMCFPASRAVLVAGSSSHGNGRFHATPATAPNTSFSTFYAVDADYTITGGTGGTAPTVTGLSLTADGLTVTATITATDPEGLAGATYAIDWGDGQTSSGSGTSFTHTYTSGGLRAILASVTDSTSLKGYRAGAIELAAPSDGIGVQGILDAIVTHAMRLGRFERVNAFEATNAPGRGVTAAVWVQDIAAIPARSGLATTSARISFMVRLYSSMLADPPDAIDPEVTAAADALIEAFTADFQLGGAAAYVDLLGANGVALGARAGYLPMGDGDQLYRIIDVTVPVVVDNVWEQAP